MGKHNSSTGMRRLKSLAAAAACVAAATIAAPAMTWASTTTGLTNPGFETGDLTGWSGNGSVTSQYDNFTAPDGRYFAVVLGGCHTNTLAQTFTATAGQTVSGWSFFKANDYYPFNDNGAVSLSVTGGGASTTVFSSSVGQVGNFGATPWQRWSWTAPADGQYTIAASSSNDLDCVASSAVGIDLAGDTTAPTITTSATTTDGAAYTSGTWTKQDVTVHFTCVDNPGGSGVASLTPDQTVSTEGDGQSVTGTCTDNAGNSSTATFGGIRIDKSGPAVAYSGNAGTYTVDQQVAITCSATDALSGVATSTCVNVTAPAYTLGLGSHTYSATATDNVGNTGSGTTSFTVQVSYASLCSLATQFSTSTDVATGLCDKLTAMSQAASSGQVKTKANILAAFDHLVAAQTGKALTTQQAATLTSLAAIL